MKVLQTLGRHGGHQEGASLIRQKEILKQKEIEARKVRETELEKIRREQEDLD
jgi:hypothetical protein